MRHFSKHGAVRGIVPALLVSLPLLAFAAGDTGTGNGPNPNPDDIKGQIYPFAPKPKDIKSHTPEETVPPTPGVGGGTGPIDEQQPRPVKASSLLGAKVDDQDGRSVGKISEIILDPRGRISYVIVSVGGFLGIGSRYYAVPWKVVDFDPSTLSGSRPWKKAVALHTTRERVLGAPRVGIRPVDRDKNLFPPPDREDTTLTQADEYFRGELKDRAGR
jgi:sporulation protein YlmC with PRC-barrel domain